MINSTKKLDPTNLIWIDLEMTGLDPTKERIIEIATIVTDAQLVVLAEGPVLAVQCPEHILTSMDDWCVKTHTKSGLVERVQKSEITIEMAQRATLEFLEEWVPKGASPICGNSVGQDRRFLVNEMPELEAFFHYRFLDVSTVKELVKRWKPEVLKGFKKEGAHLALTDIRESIAELQYYREHVFSI